VFVSVLSWIVSLPKSRLSNQDATLWRRKLQIEIGKTTINEPMSRFDATKDYYDILGASENSSQRDIERLYRRSAARHHPDRGGSEERMKSLNEAYSVLKDEAVRQEYDTQRQRTVDFRFSPKSSPPPRDVGLFGHFLSAFLCLLVGLFLLFLVRFQWFWFLWPLGVLALFVILFGVLMARSAMVAFNSSLPATNPFRAHTLLQEIIFWMLAVSGGVGVYLLLTL
jgi:hypothetical protein